MNRREALSVLGATTAGLTALAGVEAHADEGHEHHGPFDTCAKACADCQQQCDSCFHHCAGLVVKGEKDHAKAMHLCVDCAEVCATAAKLVSRHSTLSGAVCEACVKCCEECAAACEKFPGDKHLAACAKSCRDCAKACREMIKHLAH
jgi:hypothetical protein